MSREDGYKNLVPMDQRSKDEARSLGQQGGIASGAARRRKRSMREAADYYLSLPETDRRRVNAMLRDAIDPEDIDNQLAVSWASPSRPSGVTPGPRTSCSRCWERMPCRTTPPQMLWQRRRSCWEV